MAMSNQTYGVLLYSQFKTVRGLLLANVLNELVYLEGARRVKLFVRGLAIDAKSLSPRLQIFNVARRRD